MKTQGTRGVHSGALSGLIIEQSLTFSTMHALHGQGKPTRVLWRLTVPRDLETYSEPESMAAARALIAGGWNVWVLLGTSSINAGRVSPRIIDEERLLPLPES